MGKIKKLIAALLLAALVAAVLYIPVFMRIQARVDVKDYLQQVYGAEPLRVSKSDLSILYGKYIFTVEPEGGSAENPAFQVHWSQRSKKVTIDTRERNEDRRYRTLQSWTQEYQRLVDDVIRQNYQGKFAAYYTDVKVITYNTQGVADDKLPFGDGIWTDAPFSADAVPVEIALYFCQVPEEQKANLQEEADGLQQLLAEAGYSFTVYYFQLDTEDYKMIAGETCEPFDLLWW